jgi:hypothetical protein
MSALATRQSAIIPITGVDLSAATGLLLKEDSGSLAVNDSATAAARAVCLDGNVAAKDSTVGILGCLSQTFRLKAGGAITKFNLVQQKSDGTVEVDAGTGSRVIVGVALEDAASGDLFEVAPIAPRLAS